MIGLRNRLIHAYFDVNNQTIWLVVKEFLPPLIEQLEKIVQTWLPPIIRMSRAPLTM
jgi:uncharacterized protein with HEPN domain